MKQILKVQQVELKLNKMTHNVPVLIMWDYDDQAPDFDYGSKEENQKEMARFESGELLCVNVYVSSKFTCEEGLDVLGQVFVRASHLEQDILETVKEYSMVENSMNELKEHLFRCFKEIKAAMGMH